MEEIFTVKHIIIWNLKDEYNTVEIKNGIKQEIEGLLRVVPGLVEIKVETNPLASSTGDVMLYSVFKDEEALTELCKDCGTVDNCHPTDFGFASMAKALTEVIIRHNL